MTRPYLTVLTTPVPETLTRLYRSVRRGVRPLVKPLSSPPPARPYPGHGSLVRSVVDGLRAIGADFNINPDRVGLLGRVVYAPANEALEQAITWKRAGLISWLVAGPVNAFIPTERDGILLSPEIDTVIVASEWVRDFYRMEAPGLNDKIRVCPAGIDPQYWSPSPYTPAVTTPPLQAVVYWKSEDDAFCRAAEDCVTAHDLEVTRIVYGAYDAAAFKRALSGAIVSVFLSPFETQGLALAEAWGMDVPTLAWNPRSVTTWKGHQFVAGSSCPYLTSATGLAWQTLDELDAALDTALTSRPFTPRQWVASHMTDAICSAALYDIIRNAAGH